MGLKDMLNMDGIGNGLSEFISREHSLNITDRHINLYQDKIDRELIEHGITDCKISILDREIKVTGRIDKYGGGNFEAYIVPDGITWKEDNHSLLFSMVKQNVKMDKKIMHALTSSTTKLCGALFGGDYLNKKAGVVNEQGQIEIPLDGQSKTLEAITKSIELHNLQCLDRKIKVVFSVKPKEALKHGKELMQWWAHMKK